MSLREQLHGKSPVERRRLKAQAWDAAWFPKTIMKDGWRIELIQPVTVNAAGIVSLWLRITDPNGQVVPINNPLIVFNPPVFVRAGDGEPYEDVKAAMLSVIARAVRDTTGWPMPEVS